MSRVLPQVHDARPEVKTLVLDHREYTSEACPHWPDQQSNVDTKIGRLNIVYSSLWKTYHITMKSHMPYAITRCYLPLYLL